MDYISLQTRSKVFNICFTKQGVKLALNYFNLSTVKCSDQPVKIVNETSKIVLTTLMNKYNYMYKKHVLNETQMNVNGTGSIWTTY